MKRSLVIGVLVVALAVWFSWFYRFEPVADVYFLDRWTGQMIDPVYGDRWPIHSVKERAGRTGAFDDLIPSQGRERDKY